MGEQKELVIELVRPDELTGHDLFYLNRIFNTDRSDFVISCRRLGYILINADHENAIELKKLTKAFVNGNHYNCNLMDELEMIAGKRVGHIVTPIWAEWRKEKKKRKLKEQAENILKQLENQEVFQLAEQQKELLEMLFSVASGTYDEESKLDLSKGKQCCFAYGYIMGLKGC